MSKSKVIIVSRTAILLALTIVFQMMGRFMGPNNNYIVGPLVNATLIVATAATGLWGATAISVIAPFVSALTNKAAIAPLILSFSPFIALGNFVYVLCFYLISKKNKVIGIIVGSIVKFGLLLASISAFIRVMKVEEKPAAVLTGLFSWPQLFTALVGGSIALFVIRTLKRNIEL
ncbi:MAG TPA: ECF transporter S component [Clostridiaceae bacterium]|nr:ECF transporter S component [Clostridiaceae bacterium]